MRITPRSSRNEIGGVVLDANGRAALQIRLTAPPVDGAANQALVVFLAQLLRISQADITIRSGETARLKRLYLSGNSDALIAKLAPLCRIATT